MGRWGGGQRMTYEYKIGHSHQTLAIVKQESVFVIIMSKV